VRFTEGYQPLPEALDNESDSVAMIFVSKAPIREALLLDMAAFRGGYRLT